MLKWVDKCTWAAANIPVWQGGNFMAATAASAPHFGLDAP